MAYLRWRRIVELSTLDRPWLGRALLRRRRQRPDPSAGQWDLEYQQGQYDRLRRSDERYHHRLLAALVAEARPGLHVLDVGCGEGLFWQALRPFEPGRYVAIDLSAEAVGRARRCYDADVAAGRARFDEANAMTWDTTEKFDVIVFPECIEYLGDVGTTLGRYAKMLAPDGRIGLTMWLGAEPVRRRWQLAQVTVLEDEAVVVTPRGGAWLVAKLRPR